MCRPTVCLIKNITDEETDSESSKLIFTQSKIWNYKLVCTTEEVKEMTV